MSSKRERACLYDPTAYEKRKDKERRKKKR